MDDDHDESDGADDIKMMIVTVMIMVMMSRGGTGLKTEKFT